MGEAILVDNECDGMTGVLANNEANILFFSHNLLPVGMLATAADWIGAAILAVAAAAATTDVAAATAAAGDESGGLAATELC